VLPGPGEAERVEGSLDVARGAAVDGELDERVTVEPLRPGQLQQVDALPDLGGQSRRRLLLEGEQ
jgi:hypothetical protein